MKREDVIAKLQCLVGKRIYAQTKDGQHIKMNAVAVEYLAPDNRDESDTDIIIRYEDEHVKPAGLTLISIDVETIECGTFSVTINGAHVISWRASLGFPR